MGRATVEVVGVTNSVRPLPLGVGIFVVVVILLGFVVWWLRRAKKSEASNTGGNSEPLLSSPAAEGTVHSVTAQQVDTSGVPSTPSPRTVSCNIPGRIQVSPVSKLLDSTPRSSVPRREVLGEPDQLLVSGPIQLLWQQLFAGNQVSCSHRWLLFHIPE